MWASIVVPAYNEEERIDAALASILGQEPVRQAPEGFEVIVVDSQSTDTTLQKAGRYPVRIVRSVRGKLLARGIGIDHAKGEVIVACDADRTYPSGWLARILSHFQGPAVVAVSGIHMFSDVPLVNMLMPFRILGRPSHYMDGGNSAFRRLAYYQAGGFRPLNELDGKSLEQEEESAFGDRLSAQGAYVFDMHAMSFSSARRWFDPRHMAERRRGERF